MYFVVSHGLSYAVAILISILIWPQLSSRQFMIEFHYCMELCRELFLVLSLKLDNEVIIHDQDHESDSAGLLKQKKKATEKHIRHLEDKYLCSSTIPPPRNVL
jgi:predicted metallopeptidase